MKRHLGIVADGSTDREIFGKIVKTILGDGGDGDEAETVHLKRQNIHAHVERYWHDAGANGEYFLPTKPAAIFQRNVLNTLLGAFADFVYEIEAPSNRDILLITTDSERELRAPAWYTDNDWALGISKTMMVAVEQFYHFYASKGILCSELPLVMSIVMFPSTDVLVAAARNLLRVNYGKPARELKHLLYGVDDLRQLGPGELEQKALNYIDSRSIPCMFEQVPESRVLIQVLSLGRH